MGTKGRVNAALNRAIAKHGINVVFSTVKNGTGGTPIRAIRSYRGTDEGPNGSCVEVYEFTISSETFTRLQLNYSTFRNCFIFDSVDNATYQINTIAPTEPETPYGGQRFKSIKVLNEGGGT